MPPRLPRSFASGRRLRPQTATASPRRGAGGRFLEGSKGSAAAVVVVAATVVGAAAVVAAATAETVVSGSDYENKNDDPPVIAESVVHDKHSFN